MAPRLPTDSKRFEEMMSQVAPSKILMPAPLCPRRDRMPKRIEITTDPPVGSERFPSFRNLLPLSFCPYPPQQKTSPKYPPSPWATYVSIPHYVGESRRRLILWQPDLKYWT